jgi:AraC-like DNA-binding protein
MRCAFGQVAFEVSQNVRAPFHAEGEQYEFGPLTAFRLQLNNAHTITWPHHAAAHERVDSVLLAYLRRGYWDVEHLGRGARLASREFILLDPRRSYTVAAGARCEYLTFTLPIVWLSAWISDIEDAAARPIGADAPWRATLTATIEEVLRSDTKDGARSDMSAKQIAGALALALPPRRAISAERRLVHRIHQALGARFHEADLGITQVANDLGITPGHLRRTLRVEGQTTYQTALFRIRLEHAVSMLKDAGFDKVGVSEIARRCGFRSHSFFVKIFSATYGKAPNALRLERAAR